MSTSSTQTDGCGCTTIGVVIAVMLSWEANHSILWAIIHGFLSWFYVIYNVLFVK